MRLRIVSRRALDTVLMAIVEAARSSTDTAGALIKDGTLDNDRLQAAARLAVEMVTGDLVLPAGEELYAPAPKPAQSPIRTAAA